MNNDLRRREAFWRNLEYGLDQMCEDIKARTAEKWCSEDDISGMNRIEAKLREALHDARVFFILALQNLNEDWKKVKEASNE